MDSLVEKLRRVGWARYGVVYAVLFGSAAVGGRPRDIDIAVLFDSWGYERLADLGSLIDEVARATGYPYDRVDVLVLNEEAPCELVVEALSKGVLLYYRSIEEYVEDVAKRLQICWDVLITKKKLGVLEAALEAVERGWSR